MAELLIWSAAALAATCTVYVLDVEAEPAFAHEPANAQHAPALPSKHRAAVPAPEFHGLPHHAFLGRHPG